MDSENKKSPRHSYRWPKQARDLVTEYLSNTSKEDSKNSRQAQTELITKLVEITGYPRYACARFVRQSEAPASSDPRPWTAEDKQRLLELISAQPLQEVAPLMRRTPGAIRSMLHRLGASAQMGKDWFTKYTLAKALRVRAEEVQRWIDRGWLQHRMVETGKFTRQIIESDAFAEFCKEHREQIIGRRIDAARLDFVQNYVFPASHSDLLPVRESKKERAAFERAHEDKIEPQADEPDREATLTV